jgi:hypothetical protein
VNAEMKTVLEAGRQVLVDMATGIRAEVGGTVAPAGLSNRFYWLLAKNAALIAADQAGVEVKNL